MRREVTTAIALAILCTSLSAQLSGAIFTTEAGGEVVNGNIYDDCCDVYLNGGPPEKAPCTSAGLPDGHYYFQVTNPAGSVLLSSDPISEREVVVEGGLIKQYVGGLTGSQSPCTHLVGIGKCTSLGGISVQLMPFAPTPNPGGEYKVWITRVEDYALGAQGANFGFIESLCKTDNFKCRDSGSGTVLDISCPLSFSVCNDAGVCGADVMYPDPIIIGGTGSHNFSCSPASGDTFPIGVTAVMCTVTDSAGAMADCVFDITVDDCEAPELACADIPAACNDFGLCESSTVDYGLVVTDNCPNATISCSPAQGTPLPVGVTPVSCTATDASGNVSDPCNFNITVDDCEDPVLNCPDVVVDNDPGFCSAYVSYAPTATDNCPGAVTVSCTPVSGALFMVGVTQVSCWAMDANQNQSNCVFDVTVNDVEAPQIACPAPIVTGTDQGVCGAVVVFQATATDNCGATVTCTRESGSLFDVGVTNVSCTATDAAGNEAECGFTVTVNDTEDPMISCPADIVTGTDPGNCDAVVSFAATATDNCPGVTTSCAPASGSVFPTGAPTLVTCTATDAAGNSSQCDFTVTVNDDEDPEIVCPADIVTGTDPGNCDAVVSFAPTATDNCPGVTTSCAPASGSVFPTGAPTLVTCTATDAAGNSSPCDFTVTVNDDEDPEIVCPADIVTGTDPGVCDAIVTFAATATDNCGATATCTPESGSVFSKGVTLVSCTATDAAGNESAPCNFTVTVEDDEAPVLSGCVDVLGVDNDPGACDAVVNYVQPTASDNCDGATSVSCSPASGSVFPVGVTTVSCTSTDGAGNVGVCDFDVGVDDTEDPTISCPADVDVCLETVFGTEVSYADPVASDNCPGVTTSCTPASGSVFPLGITAVTCTATDAAGNTAQCGFNVNVTGATACASKFYDANGNAIDDDGTPLVGWQMVLTGTDSAGNPYGPVVDVTGAGGVVCFGDIPLGSYTITESASVVGTWVATTSPSCNFTIADCGDSPQCSFGNLCGEPLTGGHTIGFWRNKNGKNVLQANDPAWRDALNALCLVDENGTAFDIPGGGFAGAFGDWKSWLQAAHATNMAYMLSAQLAGTTLSSLYNGLDPASPVYVGQDLGSCWGGTITTVQQVLDAGAALLCADPYTPSGDINRDAQECVKDILDGLNNNDFIAPSATPCAFGF